MLFELIAPLLLVPLLLWYWSKPSKKSGLKEVPWVKEGYLPLVGHALEAGDNLLEFIRDSYKKYGPVFRIKIFGNKIAIICDPSLKKEFFDAREHDMSLYEVLARLFFVDAFTDKPEMGALNIQMVKKTIGIRYEDFAPKIIDEARRMVDRLSVKCKKEGKISVMDEMIRFVACTSSRCFIGYEMDDEFFDLLMKFTHLLNRMVVLTYFFPMWFIRRTWNVTLRSYRYRMVAKLDDIIEQYRQDPAYDESNLIRTAVDYRDENGRALTNQEIGDIVVCLLYVSSENTALGLSSAFTDMSLDENGWWNKVKEESKKYLADEDYRSLFKSPLLDAVAMESARTNNHMFALNRKPKGKTSIGGYDVSDVDTVAVCGPMIMNFDASSYKDTLKWNPGRFLGQDAEGKGPMDVVTWGAGTHTCPGKMFALYEIKAALALMAVEFEKPEIVHLGKMNYFSPSAFAERPVQAQMKSRKPEEQKVEEEAGVSTLALQQGRNVKVKYFDKYNAYLVKNALPNDVQEALYNKVIELGEKNVSFMEQVFATRKDIAYPILYDNNVYTKSSNHNGDISLIYTTATETYNSLQNSFSNLPSLSFNSIYCNVYTKQSSMKTHKDQYVNWGVSISLGASCEFQLGKDILLLYSGDVLVCDFSKVDHSVISINDGSVPSWMKPVPEDRIRCSIQVRSEPHEHPRNTLTEEEFIGLLQASKTRL